MPTIYCASAGFHPKLSKKKFEAICMLLIVAEDVKKPVKSVGFSALRVQALLWTLDLRSNGDVMACLKNAAGVSILFDWSKYSFQMRQAFHLTSTKRAPANISLSQSVCFRRDDKTSCFDLYDCLIVFLAAYRYAELSHSSKRKPYALPTFGIVPRRGGA